MRYIIGLFILLWTSNLFSQTPNINGPKGSPLVVCVAHPVKGLHWLSQVREFADRVGVGTRGFDAIQEFMEERLGSNLLSVEGWNKVGLNPDLPICLFGPLSKNDEMVISFGVSDPKKAVSLARKIFTMMDSKYDVKETPIKVGRAKGFRFSPKGARVGEGAVFAVDGKTGYLAEKQEDLSFLAKDQIADFGKDLSFPSGDVVVTGYVDILALGNVTNEKKIREFGMTAISSVRFEGVIGQGGFRGKIEGKNAGFLIMAGQAIEKNKGNKEARLRVLQRLRSDLLGFTQINIPVSTILESVAGFKSGEKPSIVPDPIWDILSSISGDVTLTTKDGLVGLSLMMSLTDQDRCIKGLSGISEWAKNAGLSLSMEKISISGSEVYLLRVGKSSSWFKFPIFAAVKDGILFVTISRAHMVELLNQKDGDYLSQIDWTPVKDAIERGDIVISHGYASDLLGNLVNYSSVAREAVVGKEAAWIGLFDLPMMAFDLLYDTYCLANIESQTTSIIFEGRFLKANPSSSDEREKAFGMALKARYAGSGGLFRQALLDMIEKKRNDLYEKKAKRMLITPEHITDYLVSGILGAIAVAAGREHSLSEAESVSFCRQYLQEACEDPKSKECKEAEEVFAKGIPTEQDEERCQERLGRLRLGK